ncbi:hypothetical protein GCM10010177_64290 [Actinomadura citrea]|nr:hypothetical protein GCM10010177_64290 [Actinomadura citrea]
MALALGYVTGGQVADIAAQGHGAALGGGTAAAELVRLCGVRGGSALAAVLAASHRLPARACFLRAALDRQAVNFSRPGMKPRVDATLLAMNSALRELTFGDQTVLVSTVVQAGTEETSAAEGLRDRAVDALENAGEAIEAVAKSISGTAERLAKAAIAPTGIEVELGLAFTAQGGVVVAGGAVQASIVVHLSYGTSPAAA